MSEHLLSHPMNPNQAMAESLGEQMSALMDGELARDQVRFLLRGVEAQSDLVRRWSNYHLISASLKREYVAVELPANFAEGVLARLDGEVVVAVANPARRIGFGALRWVGGGAIAAAVAVVALTTSRPIDRNNTPGSSPAMAVADQQAPLRQLSQPYLPLAWPLPNANSPVFNSDAAQPVSLERVLPTYYPPQTRIELIPARVDAYRVPLRVQNASAQEPSLGAPTQQ